MSADADRTGQPRNHTEPTEVEVIAAIRRLLPSDPSILAVARSLAISVRSLQRCLARGPFTYRQMLDRCRRQQAEFELQRGELNIAEISGRLGYSDPAHFVRAFRRWTGQPPTRFRAGLAARDETSPVRR